MKVLRLTDSEKEVMSILWNSGRHLSVLEVLEHYRDPKPAYTTISTIISRMLQKGFVNYSRGKGKTYYYYPTMSRGRYYLLSSKNNEARRLILVIVCLMATFLVAAMCISLFPFSRIYEETSTISSANCSLSNTPVSNEISPISSDVAEPVSSETSEEADADVLPIIQVETNVDQLPEYPGSTAAIQLLVSRHLTNDYHDHCYATFLIDEEGRPVSLTFLGNTIPDVNMDELLKDSEKWLQARKDGKVVAAYITVPLDYTTYE